MHFNKCLDISNHLTFLTAEPILYRPAQVIDFYLNARIADDGKSFSMKVFNTEITISPQWLHEKLKMNESGQSISSYAPDVKDKNHMSTEIEHYQCWKKISAPPLSKYTIKK